MAMNNISASISADKEAFLAFQDKSVARDDNLSRDEFLSQLQSAHDIQAQSKNKDEPAPNTEDTQVNNSDVAINGDVMLDQINSSLVMSTSVAKVTPNSESLDSETNDKEHVQSTDNKKSLNQLTESQNDSSLAEGEVLKGKTILAEAVEAQLKPALVQSSVITSISEKATSTNTAENEGNVAKGIRHTNGDSASEHTVNLNKDKIDADVALAKQVTSTTKIGTDSGSTLSNLTTHVTEDEKKSAISALLSKDTSLVKADKVLASLTPEQLNQLDLQAKLINTANAENKNDKASALKQLLAQFIVDNEKVQQESSKHPYSSQLNKLSLSEKQALLTQLNTYIKAQHPQGEQLSALEQLTDELKGLLYKEELTHPINTKPVTFMASETPNTTSEPQKFSTSSSSNNEADKAFKESKNDENLSKALEQSQKDGLKQTTMEHTPARVAKLFTQITSELSVLQTNQLSHYEMYDHEMALLDEQVIQTQQLQSTAHVKNVSIDPGVLQAINIVKSDAAKLLQERVSSMLSINNKEAEIRLDPPEMGSMQIRVRSDAEQAQINFVVQNQQAKEALEQSMPRLREMLAQQGIELGESTISYGQSGGETAQNNGDGEREQQAGSSTVNGENAEQTRAEKETSRQQNSSSIDYYA